MDVFNQEISEEQQKLIEDLQSKLTNPEIIYERIGISKYDYVKLQNAPKIYGFDDWVELCIKSDKDEKAYEALNKATEKLDKASRIISSLVNKGLIVGISTILGNSNIQTEDINNLLKNIHVKFYRCRVNWKNDRFILSKYRSVVEDKLTELINKNEH